MPPPGRPLRRSILVGAACAYVVIGVATAALARAAASPGAVEAWRLVAWLLSLAVFLVHVGVEHRRGQRRRNAALDVALAVALGALVLALFGPVRSHWREPHLRKVAALSLILWPLLTGIPAFAIAFVAESILGRATRTPARPGA